MKLFDTTFNRWTARLLHKFLTVIPIGITPNSVSAVGAVVSICALIIGIVQNNLVLLCWLSLICLIFDIFDGQLARFRHAQTQFGKILDAGVDIMISILIVISVFVLEKNVSLFIVSLLISLYLLRFVAVVKNCEKEIGGLRVSLIVGLLMALYLNIPLDIVLTIFVVWNTISVVWTLGYHVTSANKNSAGI